jgi:hypothetical protein
MVEQPDPATDRTNLAALIALTRILYDNKTSSMMTALTQALAAIAAQQPMHPGATREQGRATIINGFNTFFDAYNKFHEANK